MSEMARPPAAVATTRASIWVRITYRISRAVMWILCKLWFRLRRRGVEQVPTQGPVVLAANHQSYLDAVLLGITCPRRIRFLARGGLARVPLLGAWMRAVGAFFVGEAGTTQLGMRQALAVLGLGEVVALFPEGSRSRTGHLAPFQRGALLLLKKSAAVVVPVGIRSSFHAFPPGSIFPRPLRCAVHYGAPMAAAEVLAEGGLEILRQRVSELSGAPLAQAADAAE